MQKELALRREKVAIKQLLLQPKTSHTSCAQGEKKKISFHR